MHIGMNVVRAALAVAMMVAGGSASAQWGVVYGQITAVNTVTAENARAQTGGALLGGTVGLVSGRNQSNSNQALRTVGGGFAGQRIARATSNQQVFEYTILQGGRTFTVVTDEAGLRKGDCVAVERGAYNNLRLVDDSRCSSTAPKKPHSNAVREANACVAAKDTLLLAETDEAFDRAERRVRLLCDD